MGFSNEQIKAIKSNNTNELVNAGAGSGKTSVLSQHVLYLMKYHGYNIKDFLIVTFTLDAANEMKERIRKALIEDEKLKDQAKDLDACNISTFDSFNNFIVRKYGRLIGVDELAIMDDTFKQIELINIVNHVLNNHFDNENKQVIEACLNLSLKDEDNFKKLVIQVLNLGLFRNNPDEFFNNYINKVINESFVDNLINEYYQMCKDKISSFIELAKKISVNEDRDNLVDYLSTLLLPNNIDSFIAVISNAKLPKKDSKKFDYHSDDVSLRDSLSVKFRKFKDKIKAAASILVHKNTYLSQKNVSETIFNVVQEVREHFDLFKREHNLYTFFDITKFAIQLLEIEEVRNDVKNKFKYIMIDEYQDTNDSQEKLIKLIENNNVFMVGDVKQSIYRFNHANCQIFEDKYQQYKNNIGGHKIDMTKNFRSRKEFMDDINHMFSSIMKKSENPIEYFPDHISEFGNKDAYDNNIDERLIYGISALTYNKNLFEDLSKEEIEATIIALDIIDKYKKKVQVYDKDLKIMRDVTFNDFAIICDRGSKFDVFRRIFTKYKLPLYVQNDIKIEKNEVTLIIKNLLLLLLKTNNNEIDDDYIHAYCSLIRSFVFGYDDKEIYDLINTKNFKDDKLFNLLHKVKDESVTLNIKDTLLLIIDIFEIEKHIHSIGDITINKYILDYLCSLADTFDSLHKDLTDFVEFIEEIYKQELDIKASPIKDIDDSVLLINIHKSKGREFPIVYFVGLDLPFFRSENHDSNCISEQYGLTISSYYDSFRSISRELHLNYERVESNYEKLRLLYVALTRVRECAILVMPPYKKGILHLSECNSMADILSLCPIDERKISFINCLTEDYIEGNISEDKTFEIRERKPIVTKKITNKKASKNLANDANINYVKKGEKLHYLLEITDFSTKNTQFIKDINDRKLITDIINNPIFTIDGFEKIIHEYYFDDEEENITGIIDCLLIGKDEIRIIDFKLKNIDDQDYDKQVKIYKKYISKIIKNKKIDMYLLSLIDNTYREVKDD